MSNESFAIEVLGKTYIVSDSHPSRTSVIYYSTRNGQEFGCSRSVEADVKTKLGKAIYAAGRAALGY